MHLCYQFLLVFFPSTDQFPLPVFFLRSKTERKSLLFCQWKGVLRRRLLGECAAVIGLSLPSVLVGCVDEQLHKGDSWRYRAGISTSEV